MESIKKMEPKPQTKGIGSKLRRNLMPSDHRSVTCVGSNWLLIIIMEDKENIIQQCFILSSPPGPTVELVKQQVRRTSRRLIRRCRRPIQTEKVARKNIKGKGQDPRGASEGEKMQAEIMTVQSSVSNNEEGQKMELLTDSSKPRLVQKLEFDLSVLPAYLQSRYQNKEKLKNTDLMISGAKFVRGPTLESISRWPKALVVYQQPYRNNKRHHFGLLLKYEDRLITFDGVTKLWPIAGVQKSQHWGNQSDTWSCGYRVLFWLHQIQSVGMEQWMAQYEGPGAPSSSSPQVL